MPAADLTWGLDALGERASDYRLYQRYYRGDHRLVFATEKFLNAFGPLFQAFADNLCPAPVDALADRLKVEAFSSLSAAQDADAANLLWEANRMERRQGEVHVGAARDGDAYVIVWPNSQGEVRIWPQTVTNLAVDYDMDEAPDRILRAVKKWKAQDGRVRVNLYFPDRIEKWVSRTVPRNGTDLKANGFIPYVPEGDAEGGPVVENPYGRVPVFHFGMHATTGGMGSSLLRDVIPLQDALNKAIADMLVAMEFVALPQRWVTGLQIELGPDGKPVAPPFQAAADRVWAAMGDNVNMGQFPAADLSQFMAVQESFRTEIARVTGMPVHYLKPGDGTPPSGEALKTAEARLVKMAQGCMADWGPVWEDALALAVRMERMAPTTEVRLDAVWENPETRDDRNEAETQEIKQRIGVSQQQSLREMGYTDDEIEQMAEEKQANQDAFAMAGLMARDRFGPVSLGQGASAVAADALG